MARIGKLAKSLGSNAWEDVAQEAFVLSMEKAFGKEYFDRYMHKAMINIALNSIRRSNRDENLIANLAQLSPLLNLEGLDLIVDVHRVFESNHYNPRQIHACYLFFCANFSLREIAKIYNNKSHTEWKRFFDKTRTIFRKELRAYKLISPREEAAKRSDRTLSPEDKKS